MPSGKWTPPIIIPFPPSPASWAFMRIVYLSVGDCRAVGDGEAVDCAVHADCGSSGEVWTSLADLADIAGLLLHEVTEIDGVDHVLPQGSRLSHSRVKTGQTS